MKRDVCVLCSLTICFCINSRENDQSEAHSDRGFIVDKIFVVYALCFT